MTLTRAVPAEWCRESRAEAGGERRGGGNADATLANILKDCTSEGKERNKTLLETKMERRF